MNYSNWSWSSDKVYSHLFVHFVLKHNLAQKNMPKRPIFFNFNPDFDLYLSPFYSQFYAMIAFDWVDTKINKKITWVERTWMIVFFWSKLPFWFFNIFIILCDFIHFSAFFIFHLLIFLFFYNFFISFFLIKRKIPIHLVTAFVLKRNLSILICFWSIAIFDNLNYNSLFFLLFLTLNSNYKHILLILFPSFWCLHDHFSHPSIHPSIKHRSNRFVYN